MNESKTVLPKGALQTWPERIYLQHCTNEDPPVFGGSENGEITWAQDNIEGNDVEYIRADLAPQTVQQSEGALGQELRELHIRCVPEGSTDAICYHCEDEWPCETIGLLEKHSTQQANDPIPEDEIRVSDEARAAAESVVGYSLKIQPPKSER